MRRLSLGLALGLWAAPATADCVRVGDTITCVDATRGSVITTDRVRVTVNGSIVNIGSAEEFGFCPVSPPTISVGDGSTVVNNGSIVGFGLCGSAVVGGDDLTVVNAGSIITTNTAGFGIAANDRADIAVSGSILTGGLFGYGIGVRHEARIVIDRNASISTIEGGANGIFAERDPTIVNNGTIRVSALGTHGIETVGYMEFTQEGVGFARITNGGIIEANGERSSALKVRADSLVLTNTGAIDAPFSGTTRFSDLARGVEATVARLTLTNSGRIRGGGFGVVALGAATSSLLNSGTIATLDPRGRAVDLTAGQASVVNLGTISGGAVGLAVTGEVQIDNRGLIEATSAPTAANPVAAVTWQGLSQRNRLDNLGVIAARRGGMAILAGGGRDEIFNRGTIVGDVDLGGGDDAFIAFAGSSLAGRLSGGAGSDRLNFFGGGTVDFMTDGIENMVMVADEGLIVRGRLDITDTAALVSGELTVAAGGRLQARQILVSRGARLTGPGTVAGAVALQGELAPGPGIGTLAIDGDVTHEAGSTLRIDLGPGRTGDRLVLTGQARLGGTLALTSPSGVFYRGGESYDIIVAGRGIDGAFDRITELSSAFLRTATALSTDRRTLSLLVERIPYASAARTLNGAAAAGALDQALNGNRAALQATFSALDSMPLAEAAASFERLASPLPVALSSAAEVAGRAMHDSLDRWLARAPTAERWQAWGHAQRSEGGPTEKRTRGQGTAYAYRGVTQTAGFDARIGDTARAGLALGRADVDLRLRAQPAQADIEQTSLAAYAGAAWSAVRVGGGIVVGDGDADLSRPSSLDAARSVASQTDIDSRNAFVSAATAIATGAFVFEPDLGMTYARTKIDGYRETGPLALQIGPQRHTSARLEAGALLTTRHQTVRPVLLLRASRELHARHATVRASLMDDPTAPFDIIGVVPRKTWLTGSFSLAADVTDALSLRLGVEGNLTDSIGGRSVFAGAALRW